MSKLCISSYIPMLYILFTTCQQRNKLEQYCKNSECQFVLTVSVVQGKSEESLAKFFIEVLNVNVV